MNKESKSQELQALQKLLGGGLVWLALAFLVLAIFLFTIIRVGRVTGEEVGILLNRMNGSITVIPESGTRIYNGITTDFYVLDKTLQTLVMSDDEKRGSSGEKDSLKVKTIDGSDVYVDLKVQYRIVPGVANIVINTSGPKDAFKQKWARDYVRSVARNYLGELTTEEFYNSAKRDVKIQQAQKELNVRLQDFGIIIDSIVIPRKPHFYEEYEEMIKKKKLADQAVLEEQSKALAAKQKQQTLIVEETNKKNVAVEEFEGKMEQKIISAKAEGERVRKAADAYYDKLTIGAEANLYQLTQQSEGILAKKKAEATGIEAMRNALEGEGGRNIVKMEYAKKLRNITIIGKPFTIQSNIERFEHLRAPATTGRE